MSDFFTPPLVRNFTQPPLLCLLFKVPPSHPQCGRHKWKPPKAGSARVTGAATASTALNAIDDEQSKRSKMSRPIWPIADAAAAVADAADAMRYSDAR